VFVQTANGGTEIGETPTPELPLVVLVPNASISILYNRFGVVSITSDPITAIPSGGSESYVSFSWREESTNSGAGMKPQSPDTATTAFQTTSLIPAGTTKLGRFVCKVTDSDGNTAISNTCIVTLTASYNSGL
jgi:hypothetical protein